MTVLRMPSRIPRSAIVLSGLSILLCGRAGSAEAQTETQAAADVIDRDQASPTAVVISWRDPEQSGRLAAEEGIAATLRNTRTDSDLTVRVRLFALGLDQRERIKEIGRYEVGRGRQREFLVRVSEIPIQSVGTLSSIMLQAELISGLPRLEESARLAGAPRPALRARAWSSTLVYEFEPDHRAAVLYGSGRDYGVRDALDRVSFLKAAAAATAGLMNVRGRIEHRGRLVDVRRLEKTGGSAVRLGASVSFVGVNPQVLGYPPPGGGPSPGPPPPGGGTSPAPDTSNSYYFCSHWKASYQDAGYDEDFLNSPQTMDVKARYAHFMLTNQQNQEIGSGFLNSQGCSDSYKLTPGTYTFLQDGGHKKGSANVNVNYKTNQAQVIATGFSVMATPSVQKVTLKPTTLGEVTRAAAVVSQILFTNDAGLQATTYEIRAAEPCPDVGTCASGLTIKIGKNGLGVSDTMSKTIVAHEFGHTVQLASMGIPKNNYDENGSSVPMCRCDHVQIENKLHCLQSREFITAAQVEGFAQFYASKIFNSLSPTDCWFAYYKEVLFGVLVINPPVQAACEFKVTWINQCPPGTGNGTEWDWMTFLWKVHTAPSSQKTSLTDLAQIYKGACGGVKCTGSNDVTWSKLKEAAKAYFGNGSAKYLFFTSAAALHSVDH